MANNDNVHIKIEVYRDKNTNNLRILAHFDKNSPNIFKDTQGYVWLPTIEEKEFIDETFDLMSNNSAPSVPKTETQFNSTPTSEPSINTTETKPEQPPLAQNSPNETNLDDETSSNEEDVEEFQPEPSEEETTPTFEEEPDQPSRPLENQLNFTPTSSDEEKETIEFEQTTDSETNEPKPEIEPTAQAPEPKVKVSASGSETENIKNEESTSPFSQNSQTDKKETVFEVTAGNKKTSEDKLEKDSSKENYGVPEEQSADQIKAKKSQNNDTSQASVSKKEEVEQKPKKESPEDQAMIVKADADAIEKALKKHTSDRDKSMVEADEETIVNKVLSQKKWSKKKKDKEEE